MLINHNIILDVNIIIKQNFEILGSLIGTNVNKITVNSTGNLIIGSVNSNGNLVVDGNGSLTIKSGDTVYFSNIELIGDGTITIDSGAVLYASNNIKVKNDAIFTIGSGAQVFINHDFQIEDNGSVIMESDATLEVTNNFKIKDDAIFTIETGGEVIVQNNFIIEDNAVATIDGSLTVVNKFESKNDAIISGDGSITTGAVTKIKNNSTVFGGTSICTNCVYAGGCTFSSIINNWNGTTTDWFSAANWSNGIPDSNSQVNILSTALAMPIINSAGAVAFKINIENSASLELSGTNQLDIYGDFQVDGTLITNNSSINFIGKCWSSIISGTGYNEFYNLNINNTNNVVINSGSYGLRGNMSIQAGSFLTNDSLTIVSDINGTGSIGEITGVGIFGKIIMERYISAGTTSWRHIGSAVQGATIEQFNDDFVTSGYAGSNFPNFSFTSVYNYDETLGPSLGYVACSSASQVMDAGEGWHIWCGDSLSGTKAFTFDLEGEANQGTINIPLTYTSTGTVSEDGFNLICNPFPASIDWDDADWTKTNVSDATYILNSTTQQYATYISGASANGGSRYIASQQSFWVQTYAANPVLTATESVKTTIDHPFIKSSQQNYSSGMHITLKNPLDSVKTDEIVIRHISGSIDNFEYEYDATKWWAGWGNYPQLSILNKQDKDLTIHSFDKGYSEWSIPIRAIVFQNGIYELLFNDIEELNVPCIKLEDTYTGIYYDIKESSSISFELYDTTYTPRFIIHFGKNYNIKSIHPSCHQQKDGQVQIDLNTTEIYNYNLLLFGNSIQSGEINGPLTINNLEQGLYNLKIPYLENMCHTTSFNLLISDPKPLSTKSNIIHEVEGNDGSINIRVFGGTPPYRYLWKTGDTTSNIENLSAGIYTLNISDVNDCNSSNDYLINSSLNYDKKDLNPEFIFYDSLSDLIVINNTKFIGLREVNLFDLKGKKVQSIQLNFINGSSIFKVNKNLSSGIYVLGYNSEITGFKFSINK